jgi:hypothetical protein
MAMNSVLDFEYGILKNTVVIPIIASRTPAMINIIFLLLFFIQTAAPFQIITHILPGKNAVLPHSCEIFLRIFLPKYPFTTKPIISGSQKDKSL